MVRYNEAFEQLRDGAPKAADLFAGLKADFPEDALVKLHCERIAQGILSTTIVWRRNKVGVSLFKNHPLGMLREFSADRVIAILLAGIIAGLVTLITSVSFAALMFNGKLAPFISSGITILIATAVVGGSIFSLFSSCPAPGGHAG